MRLVQLVDYEDGEMVMLANTDMLDEEIQEATEDEELDEQSMDYEQKCEHHAEKLGKTFERVYTEEVSV